MGSSPLFAVFNPAAGGGRSKDMAPAMLDRLRASGIAIEVSETSRPGDAMRITREAYAAGRRDFLAIGGDGTGFEVINGLFPAAAEKGAARPTLGLLPTGTGNSFLRDFSHDTAEYSMKAILDGRRRSCDVIRLTHRDGEFYYINLLSMGFVADVAATRNRRFQAFGQFGYVLGVFKELAGLHPRAFPMKIDGAEEIRRPLTFLSINNSRFTGGKMMMAPAADTSDGLADLILVDRMGRFSLLKAFPTIFKGTHVGLPQIHALKVRTIEFDMDREIDVMVDGESLRVVPKRLEVLPGAFDARA
ncbi:MAG: diacylglycerol kinase family protein [Pseudomonadota bacterium]